MSCLKRTIDFINGFRKWTVMILVLLVAVVFRIVDYVDGAQFVDLLKGTVIAFFTANVGEHVVNVIKEKFKSMVSKKEGS